MFRCLFPDECENKKCEFYAECKTDNGGEAKCVCPSKCEISVSNFLYFNSSLFIILLLLYILFIISTSHLRVISSDVFFNYYVDARISFNLEFILIMMIRTNVSFIS